MLKYLKARPLLLCGILCAVMGFLGYYSLTFSVAAGVLALLVGIYLIKNKRHTAFVLCCGILILTSVSCSLSGFKAARYSNFPKIKTTAELTLCELYENTDYFSGVFQVNSCEAVDSNLKIYGFMNPQSISVGDVVNAEMSIYATEPKYRLSNFSEGVFLTANIYKIEKTGKTDFIIKAVENVKKYIKSVAFKYLNTESAATVSALIYGEKQYFNEAYETAVRRAGVSHVMVVSGMHLSISVLFFVGLLSRIWYNRFVKAFTMLTVVLVLTSVCGFSVSILRAGVTYIFAAVLLMLNRPSLSENNLGGAVALLVMLNPLIVFSGAFWLSVLSTFGILCIAKYIFSALERTSLYGKPVLYGITSAAVITLSATLLTLPVTVYLFGEISLVGVITNLLISYAVTIVIWLSLIGVLFNLFLPILAKLLFLVCEPIVVYVNTVIKFLGGLPFAAITVPKETAFLFLAVIVGVFWIILSLSDRKYQNRLKEKGIKTKKETRKSKKQEGFIVNS